MRDRQARRQWQALVDGLALPDPFDLAQFCKQFEQGTGRPIVLMPRDSERDGPAPCGLLARTDDRDYVFYETATSRVHLRQNIFHELGHLLADHAPMTPVVGAQDPGLLTLLPQLDPTMVRRVLARGGYDRQIEREAELIGSLLGLRVEASLRGHARPAPSGDPALDRMAVIFGRDSD